MENPSALILFFVSFLLLAACSSQQTAPEEEAPELDYDLLLTLPDQPISYHESVKPVLENRCVVCHGCYDAPCQLKLSSMAGLQRGASKERVYDGARILPAPPSRLFIDAKTTAEWREKAFYPVLNETAASSPEQNLEASTLYRMLRLKQIHPQPRTGTLPKSFDLALDRKQFCPKPEEFDRFADEHPLWGMPYAMPNLSAKEYGTLVQWIAQGSPAETPNPPSAQAAKQIEAWERFFNGTSNKQKLVSRYLYEHLFQAHLHFTNGADREFYRLIRSSTPPGQPADEIASVLPLDASGSSAFYYRVIPYLPSVVAKNHVVYELSPHRMERFNQLFLQPDYAVDSIPGHDTKVATNPFKVYDAIPVASRYKFLLDDARFFIEGFIKGPVCRGQIALNVIEDQFWVVFFDPDKPTTGNDAEFIRQNSQHLSMPTEMGDTLKLFSAWDTYWKRLKKYMLARQASFENIHSVGLDDAMSYIWKGGGNNPNAALTVFRHMDSASVRHGLVGDFPETAWLLDYPLFERIHYLLVAGFNVYGNVGHQLNTRLYMDFLRMEGEDNFLAFLPVSDRKRIRDSWYQGMRSDMKKELNAPMDWLNVESVIGYRSDNPQRELYKHIEAHLGTVAGPADLINRCEQSPCSSAKTDSFEYFADQAMASITHIKGLPLDVFPDLAFVQVVNKQDPEKIVAYTLVRNKAYKNVSSIFEDEDRRDLENDTMTVIKGLEGSYPNFFYIVDLDETEPVNEGDEIISIKNRRDYEKFVANFGIRRTSNTFWQTADWFQARAREKQPVLSGIYDLNRYRNY